MKASDLVKMLQWRHREDVFIPECKDGGSWNRNNHLRLDAFVIRKSFTNPLTIGYEIKVSRSDFLGDKKWQGYLPYCNEFYFVCPNGMIKPEELPDGVGLIHATKNGKGLRRIEYSSNNLEARIPDDMYKYILFSRSDIIHRPQGQKAKREFWKYWLHMKEVDAELGKKVGKALAEKIKTRIVEVGNRNSHLRYEVSQLNAVKKVVKEFGVETSTGIHVEEDFRNLLLKAGLKRVDDGN